MRLIDADALFEAYKELDEYMRLLIDCANMIPEKHTDNYINDIQAQMSGAAHMAQLILEAPTIDPVVHGQWIDFNGKSVVMA